MYVVPAARGRGVRRPCWPAWRRPPPSAAGRRCAWRPGRGSRRRSGSTPRATARSTRSAPTSVRRRRGLLFFERVLDPADLRGNPLLQHPAGAPARPLHAGAVARMWISPSGRWCARRWCRGRGRWRSGPRGRRCGSEQHPVHRRFAAGPWGWTWWTSHQAAGMVQPGTRSARRVVRWRGGWRRWPCPGPGRRPGSPAGSVRAAPPRSQASRRAVSGDRPSRPGPAGHPGRAAGGAQGEPVDGDPHLGGRRGPWAARRF